MKEILHQFGFVNNRVRVGILQGKLLDKHFTHGVVLGNTHSGDPCRSPIMVDHPKKLNSLNNAMVVDMVEQIDKLGVQVELIQVNTAKSTCTYRTIGAGQVELVSKTPRAA
jgi:hypothetical protein